MIRDDVMNIKKGLCLPVIAAPMFLVSNPDTVIAGCKAGIISSFPSLNARTVKDLEKWMIRITEELHTSNNRVWAVNLIVHQSNKRYKEDLRLIQKYQTPLVITSLGDPTHTIESVHEYGGLVFSDVASVYHARKASKAGVDGLILVCSGAGGHGGTYSPFAFVQEVRQFWNGPLVLAGSISSGSDVLAAEIMGADFAYMGTRFIATKESSAEEEYQNMLIESTVEDILYTDAFTGVNGNYLLASIKKAGLDPTQLIKKDAIDFSKLDSDKKAWKDIWSAGQGVGKTKAIQTYYELVNELKVEYKAARQRIN